MPKTTLDKSSRIIIGFCIFSIILSLTALLLGYIFSLIDSKKTVAEPLPPPFTVVIDAGHGGLDGGATAIDGTKEKDLNLLVALSLGEMLKLNGYNVIYTRTEDIMLTMNDSNGSAKMQDLKKRVEIANYEDNSLFISIHMNKFSQEKYCGLQVFYSGSNPKSEKIANLIQANTKNMLQENNNRETKKAGSNIYLLHKTKVPAVLVECGFLSNPEECELLKNDGYRKEIAAVIYSSVIEFFEQT